MADTTFEGVRDERTARAVIASATTPGDYQTNHVLRLTGSGLATLRLALSDEPIGGLPRAALHLWRRRFEVTDPGRVFGGIELGERTGQLLIPGDPHWPTGLDPFDHRTPVALWAEGDTSLLADPLASRAALVGTHQPSKYGAEMAGELASSLALDGRTIVSFVDTGIPRSVAQATCAESDRVILVLSDSITQERPGFDSLHERVAEKGLLLTAQPPNDWPVIGTAAANRLLAALSGMTTVVEEHAGWDYRWVAAPLEAKAYGRPVGAVPGRATDRLSQGTNALIRDGLARLVQDVTDITDLLDRPRNGLRATPPGRIAPVHATNREHSLAR